MTALEEIKKALEGAEQFIVNGVELGYIRMPNPETPDSAHGTLPMIREAQTALESLQRENEELRQAKWQQKHVDTMNDMVAMGMARDAAEDEVKRLRGLLDGLCAWLLHRFGPDSPEGREASSRTALASTGGEHNAE